MRNTFLFFESVKQLNPGCHHFMCSVVSRSPFKVVLAALYHEKQMWLWWKTGCALSGNHLDKDL